MLPQGRLLDDEGRRHRSPTTTNSAPPSLSCLTFAYCRRIARQLDDSSRENRHRCLPALPRPSLQAPSMASLPKSARRKRAHLSLSGDAPGGDGCRAEYASDETTEVHAAGKKQTWFAPHFHRRTRHPLRWSDHRSTELADLLQNELLTECQVWTNGFQKEGHREVMLRKTLNVSYGI